MKKIYLTIGLLVVLFVFVTKVMAQTTEPGANLPLLPGDETSTEPTYAYSSTPYSALTTATTSYDTIYVSVTATSLTQSAIDDAETGTEVIFLAILSITGGIGIFLIKKYFDFKRYRI